MTSIIDLNPFELEKLSIKDYFKTLESTIGKDNNIDKLTDFLPNNPFQNSNRI